MSEVDWSTTAVRTLVQQYQRRPELWNKHHSLYRAASAKLHVWTTIAEMFGCEVTELRKKFNSLLASYRRERTKVKEGHRSHWFLYPHMSFLPGYIANPPLDADAAHAGHYADGDAEDGHSQEQEEALANETYEAVETIYQYEMESDETQASEEAEAEVLIKHEVAEGDRGGGGGGRAPRRAARRPRLRPARAAASGQAYVDARIQELQRTLRAGGGCAGAAAPRKDDCDTYGEYIAATLRKHGTKTRCYIKQAINNILFEQEMNQYNNPLDADMITEMLEPSDE